MSKHVTITGRDEEAMSDLVRKHRVAVFAATVQRRGRGLSVDAFVDDERIDELRRAGYRIKQLADSDGDAARRLRDVGQGNRYRERLREMGQEED